MIRQNKKGIKEERTTVTYVHNLPYPINSETTIIFSIILYIHTPVYSLKHFPGRFRPALPALWLAEALEMGVTTSDSMAL